MKTPSSPGISQDETFSLTCVIGITQFVFFALGLMILSILVKVATIAEQVTPLAQFLTRHGLWLVLVPLAWSFFAGVFSGRSRAAARFAAATGVVLAALIAIIFTIAILRPAG